METYIILHIELHFNRNLVDVFNISATIAAVPHLHTGDKSINVELNADISVNLDRFIHLEVPTRSFAPSFSHIY